MRASVLARSRWLLFLCACAGGAAPEPPSREVVPGNAVALPLTFREGLPELDVAVGAVHVPLLLDTGAGAAIALHPSVLARVTGVSYTGHVRRFQNARGNRLTSRAFVIDSVFLGPLAVHGVAGQELVYAPDYVPPNRDGYVGRALFARHRLLIDYGAKTLWVLSGEPQLEERALRNRPPTKVEIGRDGILLDATLDGAPARFVLDTGATTSVLRPRTARESVTRHDLVVCGRAFAGFELLEQDVGPPGVDGMLGRTFFEGRRVLVDFPGSRLWVD